MGSCLDTDIDPNIIYLYRRYQINIYIFTISFVIEGSLVPGPHYWHCRTRVSPPTGRFGKRFAGELALIVISARPLGLRNPDVIYHNANNESLLSFYVKSIMGGKS